MSQLDPEHNKYESEWLHKVQKENIGLLEWISVEDHDNESVSCEAEKNDKELRDQMKDKDDEVEQLKTELISQKEELEEPIEELEETREFNHDLETQLEEAKRIE